VNLTDQELAEHWEQDAVERSLPMDVLEEAVSRGLPWSKLVIVELMRLQVYGAEMNQMFRFMNRFSDCPEDLKKARNWLSNHAEQLEWDPALKRWVLPPPP
jgi:ribosomal protein L13